MADGHLSKKRQVTISLVDKQIIIELARRIKFTAKIGFRPAKGKRKAKHILVLSGPVADFLLKQGFPLGVKTGREFIPTSVVSEKTMPHFLRGLSDGDGSFYVDSLQNTLGWSLVSASLQLIYNLQIYLLSRGIIVGGHVERRRKEGVPVWVLSMRHHDAISIGKYMYKKSTIRLARKYESHYKLCSRKIRHILQAGKTCSIPGCKKPCRCKNLCKTHYTALIGQKPERRAYLKKYLADYYVKNREKLLAAQRQRHSQPPYIT